MFELRYVEDESVQSWIFRNLVVDGEIDFSSILSSEGDWYNNVSFRKNCPERMTRTRDVELLRFLRNSGLALKFAGKYDNPVDYLDRIYSIFQPLDCNIPKISADGSIAIRFCPECILQAVQEYGFGYFKWEWLQGLQCLKHGRLLCQLKKSKRETMVLTLLKVLSGCPLDVRELTNLSVKHTQRLNRVSVDYHIMPCFMVDFYLWATMRRNDHSLGDGFHNWYYQDGRRKPVSRECLIQCYEYYTKFFPEQSHRFIKERGDIKFVRFGIKQPGSLSEKLLKSSKYNCSYCTKWEAFGECPAKPIKLFVIEPQYTYTGLNPCDFFLKFGTPYFPRRPVDRHIQEIDFDLLLPA
ncbi:TPA: hypothetical protein ACPJ19_001268 [Vibrio diabolicus]